MAYQDDDVDGDEWSRWLLQRRHGRTPAVERIVKNEVAGYADRLLDAARLEAGMSLVDVGAGEGVVGFRAIERVGASLHVLMVDVSRAMLDHARSQAMARGVIAQCCFVECSADDLRALPDHSADVIVVRAVLAYVHDKPAAIAAFHRVLKPGGRLSMAEPMFQDEALELIAARRWLDEQGADVHATALPLLLRWRGMQLPDTLDKLRAHPLTSHSGLDLMELCVAHGFRDVHLEFSTAPSHAAPASWDAFLRSAPNPWSPMAGEILANAFDARERDILVGILRPIVESGAATGVSRVAYLDARKAVAS